MKNTTKIFKIKPFFSEDDVIRFPEELAKETADSLRSIGYDAKAVGYYVEVNANDDDKFELSRWGQIISSRRPVKSSRKITSSNKYEFEIHDMDGYAEYPMTMTDAWGHVFDVSDFDKPYDSYEYWKDDVLQAIDDDEFVDGNEDYLDELYDYQNELCREYYGHNLIRSSRKSIKSSNSFVNLSRNEMNLNSLFNSVDYKDEKLSCSPHERYVRSSKNFTKGNNWKYNIAVIPVSKSMVKSFFENGDWSWEDTVAIVGTMNYKTAVIFGANGTYSKLETGVRGLYNDQTLNDIGFFSFRTYVHDDSIFNIPNVKYFVLK